MFKYTNNEIVKSTKTDNGTCPNCNSDEIDYMGMETDTDFDGIVTRQHCVCKNCGLEYEEWYRLVYDGFTTNIDSADYSFDANGELT